MIIEILVRESIKFDSEESFKDCLRKSKSRNSKSNTTFAKLKLGQENKFKLRVWGEFKLHKIQSIHFKFLSHFTIYRRSKDAYKLFP